MGYFTFYYFIDDSNFLRLLVCEATLPNLFVAPFGGNLEIYELPLYQQSYVS